MFLLGLGIKLLDCSVISISSWETKFLMFIKRIARVSEMGCCGCFGFSFGRKSKKIAKPPTRFSNHISQELLLDEEIEFEEEEEEDDYSYNGDMTDNGNGDEAELQSPAKRSEEIILYRTQNGLICREFPVKETHRLIRYEVRYGIYLRVYN